MTDKEYIKGNPKKPLIVTSDDIKAIRAKNKKIISEYIKEHSDQKEVLNDRLQYCLCDNLFRYKICKKDFIEGSKGVYHFHVSAQCTVFYSIVVCTDKRYKPIVKIIMIVPINNQGHDFKRILKALKSAGMFN